MTTALPTGDYDHIVVIDTQVVLEAKPLDQLPWGDLFPGSVLMVVVRQVQTEIDGKKHDGRLGKRSRAFNALVDSFIETRVPARVLQTPRIDVATIANRSIDWDELDDLDRNDPDDRIVAQALNALVDNPSKLVLLSHDMRPRDAAKTRGLRAIKLPEDWLRQPEPSPDERRITDLENRIRLLSADQPKRSVRVELVTPGPWVLREVAPASDDDIDEIQNQVLACATRQTRPDIFNQSVGSYDYSYDSRVEEWSTQIREDIPLMHKGLTRHFSQYRVRVTVENEGTISAEGLSLEIRSGNTVLHSRPYLILLEGTRPPRPRLGLSHLYPALNPRDLIAHRNEPYSFYWDERGPGDHLILSCASFRQGKQFEIEVSVEIGSRSIPKSQIEAVVTASNMKGEARGGLVVDAQRMEVAFAEMFNVGTGTWEKRPPFEVGDDWDLSDINLFRNSGGEYDAT